MEWDLGLTGVGVLVVMSLAFGLIAHAVLLVLRQSPIRWLWAIASAAYFLGGLFISEVLFGWATADDLQPNIDGLSFDEVLLFGLVPGVVAVVITWFATRTSEIAARSA
jgi:hypothetical protein